ncbi:hypothetical protein, partial [Moorena sp. SIO3I6]|uniref:hypothetical protein n=1 Tax=Moorena sp. SIO3I6 TaxID=2607831 RepID=UPI0013FAD27E
RQLKNIGTPDACEQVERIIGEFTELPSLKTSLISAKESMRRKTWQQLQPEEVIDEILDHDPRVNQTVPVNQATYIENYNYNEGDLSIKNNIKMVDENNTINTNGGDVINNTGIVDNRKIGNNNNIIANGEGNKINVNDSKSNPNSGDIWAKGSVIIGFLALVVGVLGLFFNGISNEPIKRFFGIDQQPSLSPTPTVPSPSSTPDSE